MKVEWSFAALEDLSRIVTHLNDKHPTLSRQLGSEIDRRIQLIRDYPKAGRALGSREHTQEIALTILRAVYVFQYRISDDRIVILRVYHGKEDRT